MAFACTHFSSQITGNTGGSLPSTAAAFSFLELAQFEKREVCFYIQLLVWKLYNLWCIKSCLSWDKCSYIHPHWDKRELRKGLVVIVLFTRVCELHIIIFLQGCKRWSLTIWHFVSILRAKVIPCGNLAVEQILRCFNTTISVKIIELAVYNKLKKDTWKRCKSSHKIFKDTIFLW